MLSNETYWPRIKYRVTILKKGIRYTFLMNFSFFPFYLRGCLSKPVLHAQTLQRFSFHFIFRHLFSFILFPDVKILCVPQKC